MGSKERIARLKEETKQSILEAALEIVKVDGWQALSMRKIADKIEYTAPIIYEYFENKEGILLELTRQGYLLLKREVKAAMQTETTPAKQLEAMWVAYWNFAFAHREYYQLMYGVEMNCCSSRDSFHEPSQTINLFYDKIREVMQDENPDEEKVCRKHYTFWSLIHGLISINLVKRGVAPEMNNQILQDAIKGIIKYIND